jgi:hypothetical protein
VDPRYVLDVAAKKEIPAPKWILILIAKQEKI